MALSVIAQILARRHANGCRAGKHDLLPVRYGLFLALFAAWVCWGVFPLVSYETDSQELVLGCDIMYAEGWSLPPTYSYEYRMHPLTIISVVALRHLAPMLTCEQIYCLLSAFSAFLFLVGSMAFVRRVTGSGRMRILVAAMLLPEMYAIAMYPSSAIHAAACMVWAFVALTDGGRKAWKLHPLLLLCIAPLFRVDVVAVYPAILPLFLFLGHSIKKSILLSAAYGVLVVGVSLTLFWLLRADVLSSLGAYGEWNGRISRGQVLRAVFGFYSVAYLVLLPVGVCRLWRKKLFKVLLLVLLPVLSVHFVYRSMGCASKHYLYIAPFVITAGVYGLSALQAFVRRSRALRWAAAVAFAVFLLVSVRVVPSSRPWFARDTMYTAGIALPLWTATMSSGTLSVAIGAGQYIPTEDEYMLATGHLFYPWYIHTHKEYLKQCAEENCAALDTAPSPTVLALSYAAWASILSRHLADGYGIRLDSDYYGCTLAKDGRRLTFRKHEMQEDDNGEQAFMDYVDGFCSDHDTDELYLLVNMPRYRHYLDRLSDDRPMDKITDNLYRYHLK